MRAFANLFLLLLCLNSYGQSGQLNTTFHGGAFTDFISGGGAQADAILVQADGKVVAGGMSLQGSVFQFCLTRYLPDGSRDAAFGNGGRVLTPIGNGSYIKALVLLNDGKILAGGSASIGSGVFVMVRYLPDGTPDPAFGSGGFVFTALGLYTDVIKSLVVRPDGGIIAAGESYNGTRYDLALARYTASGTLVESLRLPLGPRHAFAMQALLQPDGHLLVTGSVFDAGNTADAWLMRFLPGGFQPDVSFGTGGRVLAGHPGADDFGKGLALQPDGKILLCGSSWKPGTLFDLVLYRFLPDGTVDHEFGDDGRTVVDVDGHSEDAAGMALQPDGSILVGGSSTRNGHLDFALFRFLHTGATDSSFGSGGRAFAAIGSFDDIAYALAFNGTHVFMAGLSHRQANGAPSDFALASFTLVNTPLPVRFTKFYARQENGVVQLHWEVEASEMDFYVLERSADGQQFAPLSTHPAGADGLQQYASSDALPPSPLAAYRVKGVERSGAAFYSNILVVRGGSAVLQVFPNPATHYVQVHLPGGWRGRAELRLYSAGGAIAWQGTEILDGNSLVTTIPLASLSRGVYLLQVQANGRQYAQKLVKE